MKIAVLSSATAGGAGIAAFRLYEALCDFLPATDSCTWVDIQHLGEPESRSTLDDSLSNETLSNTHFTGDTIAPPRSYVIAYLKQFDVLNIHWSSYLISISELYELARLGIKILFTLHDFYYLTGGCHYPASCAQYRKACLLCPQVDTERFSKNSVEFAHTLKRKLFSFNNVFCSAPSDYLVEMAVGAGIVSADRAFVLRNVYKPITDQIVKPNQQGVTVLLIADSFLETRKNMALAVSALSLMADAHHLTINLVGKKTDEVSEPLKKAGCNVECYGSLDSHEELVQVFLKSDFLLSPSLEDNWPNILVEAGAYGVVPIVGPGHGCENFVHRFGVGFVAAGYTPIHFMEALKSALDSSVRVEQFSRDVRAEHAPNEVAGKYLNTFRQLLVADA